jgi:chalcone isomerase-like protein
VPAPRFLLPLLLALLPAAAAAVEVAGVQIPDKAQVDGRPLVLNGAGLRTRIVFKVYVGALYLPEKTSDAAKILASPGSKRVSMTLLRDLTSKQLIDALEEGVRANHTEAALAALRSRLDVAESTMRDLGSAKQGSVIALEYVPGSGTRITVDGAAKAPPIAGEDFYAALLRVWIGERPVDASLKKAMLGQER